jgi:hypothetical protein
MNRAGIDDAKTALKVEVEEAMKILTKSSMKKWTL